MKALVKMGRVDLAQQQRDALAPAVAVLLPQAEAAETEETVDKGLAASASAPGLSGTPSDLPSPAPLNPWTDDDAQERYAALLEAPADALEFELALAWLATSGQVAAAIAPLAKRAHRLAERDRQHYAAALLLAAHDPKVPFLPRQYWQNTSTSLVLSLIHI